MFTIIGIRVIAIFCFLVSLICVLDFGMRVKNNTVFLLHSKQVNGEIYALEAKSHAQQNTTEPVNFQDKLSALFGFNKEVEVYTPKIQFVNDTGALIKFNSDQYYPLPQYKIADRLPVFYLPGDSHTILINSPWSKAGLWSLWSPVFMIMAIAAGFGVLGRRLMQLKIWDLEPKADYFKKHGCEVTANIIAIEQDHDLMNDGLSPFIISCQWQDTQQKAYYHLCRSEPIWFDPQEMIHQSTISVWLHPVKPDQYYYVDVSMLPLCSKDKAYKIEQKKRKKQ